MNMEDLSIRYPSAIFLPQAGIGVGCLLSSRSNSFVMSIGFVSSISDFIGYNGCNGFSICSAAVSILDDSSTRLLGAGFLDSFSRMKKIREKCIIKMPAPPTAMQEMSSVVISCSNLYIFDFIITFCIEKSKHLFQ